MACNRVWPSAPKFDVQPSMQIEWIPKTFSETKHHFGKMQGIDGHRQLEMTGEF